MTKVTKRFKDPKEFWPQIKRLNGNKASANQHLVKNNVKLIDDEKEAAHRNMGQYIENHERRKPQYDIITETEVEGFLTRKEHQSNIYELLIQEDCKEDKIYRHINTNWRTNEYFKNISE